jgi:hypothetical protein
MAKKTITLWGGSGFTTKLWPPGDPFKPDRDATRWLNSSKTTSDSLHSALSYFLSTGWPTEALDDFLRDIVPKAGWSEDWEGGPTVRVYAETYRPGMANGPSVSQLFNGYWEPPVKPRGRMK